MFNHKKSADEDSDIQQLITSHISKMDGLGPETEEYTAQANNLKTLMEVRKLEEEIEKPWRPDANTVIAATAQILGIVAILSFEKVNVITSKSLSFVPKIRV